MHFALAVKTVKLSPSKEVFTLFNRPAISYEQTVKDAVSRGLSYPKALNEAYLEAAKTIPINGTLADLSKPNNILGFHYMEAAQAIGSDMQAATIPRIVAQYHDDAIEGNQIASATGIRKSFFNSDGLSAVTGFMPETTRNFFTTGNQHSQAFGSWSTLYPYLRFTILREGPERLDMIADVTEGIENLLSVPRPITAHSKVSWMK